MSDASPRPSRALTLARQQWERGDWEGLLAWDQPELTLHRDAGEILLLCAGVQLKLGKYSEARQLIERARKSGVSNKLIKQILVVSQEKENTYFKGSSLAKRSPQLADIHRSWQAGHWDSLTKIDNANLPSLSNRKILVIYAACGYQQLDNMEDLQRCTLLARKWHVSSEKIKDYLLAGVHNTLALTDVLTSEFKGAAKNFKRALSVDQETPEKEVIRDRINSQLNLILGINHEKIFEKINSFI